MADEPTSSTPPPASSPYDPPTNTLRPASDALITVRVIKSFTYRTCKNLVLPHVDLEKETVAGLKERVRKEIGAQAGFKPYRPTAAQLDTIKLYTKAHGSKTTNLIINFDNDEECIFGDDEATLASLGLENEAEVSFFNRAAYEEFKANPETKWI